MLKKKKITIILFLGLSCLFFLPYLGQQKIVNQELSKKIFQETTAWGADESGNSDSEGLVTCKLSECTICDLYKLVAKIFNWLLGISFAVAVLFMVVSGFLYILSVGDSGFMSMAKEGLKYSLIGFAICLTSWLAIHILFTVMGANNQGDWWTIQCDDSGGGGSTGQEMNVNTELANQKMDVNGNLISQKKITNELATKIEGGRNNPISLPQLATKGIDSLPENKYFFIHGLGGQSTDDAAKQLVKIAQEADSVNKLVFAAVPEEKKINSATVASTLVNLNSYLSSDPAVLQQEIQKLSDQAIAGNPTAEQYVKDLANSNVNDRFVALALQIMEKSSSQEVPLIISDSAENVSAFSNVWPVDPNYYAGEKNKLWNTLTTMKQNGVLYDERGPLTINGDVPADVSNFSINVDYDEAKGKYVLNLDNPVDISFPDNISPAAARAATRDFAKVLVDLQDQEALAQDSNNQEDITTRLSSLLYKDNLAYEEVNGSDTSSSDDFFEMSLDDYIKKNWGSNGAGALPAGIATTGTATDTETNTTNSTTTSNSSNATTPSSPKTKQINQALEQELQSWIKDVLNKNNGGSSNIGITPNGDRSVTPSESVPSTPPPVGDIGKGSARPVGETFQGVPNPAAEPVTGIAADPNSMVSLVSVGINRQLSTEERNNIRDLIVNIQKEEFEKFQQEGGDKPLNIPVDYVMCLMQAESAFNPMATSPTGAAGLGQFTQDSQEQAAKVMQKKSPKHYEEFSKKYDKDLATLMSPKKSGLKNAKNTLKKDANLAAALTYDFIQFKAGEARIKGPVSESNLRTITHRYVGDGNEESQWQSIKRCMNSNGWVPKPPKNKK